MSGLVEASKGVDHQVDREELVSRSSHPLSTLPRPILRWAGSKQKLLPSLIDALPDRYGTYYEPFFGSGALFFLLRPRRAVLSDICEPLVETYEAVRRAPDEVHEALKSLDPLDREMYYEVRSQSPADAVARAARFLYLNRSCWNGLYRVNRRGEFNVPYGAPKTAALPDLELLTAAADAMSSRVTIHVRDFAASVKRARAGDLVFFDPPYVTGHNNNGFVDYNEDLFSWADQVRLSEVATALAERGVHVIVTNANHESVLDLYKGFAITETTRFSTLANNTAFRRPITEALIHSAT